MPTVYYIDIVGDLIGVPNKVWKKWLRDGRKAVAKAESSVPLTEVEALSLMFLDIFREARADGMTEDMQCIAECAQSDWKAAAWRLERLHPEKFGVNKEMIKEMAAFLTEQKKQRDKSQKDDARGSRPPFGTNGASRN